MNKIWFKVASVLVIAVSAGVIYSCSIAGGQETASRKMLIDGEETAGSSEIIYGDDETEETESETETVCVYVCGHISSSGIYYLPEGARIYEAVDAAGGVGKDGTADSLNLAEKVYDGQRIYIPSVDEASTAFAEAAAGDGLVNINTAQVAELTTLPGIGNAKAEAIISYREQEGFFKTTEDIKNVSGIGDASFEKLKDKIRV